jgi:hypothetical protein
MSQAEHVHVHTKQGPAWLFSTTTSTNNMMRASGYTHNCSACDMSVHPAEAHHSIKGKCST